MDRETLSNNTEYRKRLREARIKGVPVAKHPSIVTKEQIDYESRRQVCDHALLDWDVFFIREASLTREKLGSWKRRLKILKINYSR